MGNCICTNVNNHIVEDFTYTTKDINLIYNEINILFLEIESILYEIINTGKQISSVIERNNINYVFYGNNMYFIINNMYYKDFYENIDIKKVFNFAHKSLNFQSIINDVINNFQHLELLKTLIINYHIYVEKYNLIVYDLHDILENYEDIINKNITNDKYSEINFKIKMFNHINLFIFYCSQYNVLGKINFYNKYNNNIEKLIKDMHDLLLSQHI